MVQAAVADPSLRRGQLMSTPAESRVISRFAEGALADGNLVGFGTDAETQCLEIAALPAADGDAIMTAAALGSAVAAQSLDAANFDGATNRDRIAPAQAVTVTFDAANLVDWDTASGECRIDIYGVDALGADIKDTIARPNGAAFATVFATELAFASVYHVDVEACNAAAGTAVMGLNSSRTGLSAKDFPGVALYESMKEPNTAARLYADEEAVSILIEGRVAVIVEHAVSVGDDAYVRVLAAGADLTGQWTGQDGADTPATYARFPGAKFTTAAAADAVAVLELRGV